MNAAWNRWYKFGIQFLYMRSQLYIELAVSDNPKREFLERFWIYALWLCTLVGVENRQNAWVALDHAPVERAFFCSQAKSDNLRNMKYIAKIKTLILLNPPCLHTVFISLFCWNYKAGHLTLMFNNNGYVHILWLVRFRLIFQCFPI